MKPELQNIIRIRIAANILYRIGNNLKINTAKSDIYDFIVFNKIDQLSFGVKVGSSTYPNSQEYKKYIELLKTKGFNKKEEQIPIAIMCVNENQENARIGFVVGWRFNRPIIYSNVSYRTVNSDNWSIFYDNARSMDSVIRLLSDSTIGIIKDISIRQEFKDGRSAYAKIIYMRRFTQKYRMKSPEIIDEKQKFERLVWGIPEEEYPADRFDNDFLAAIKKEFRNAECKSSTILFSSDLIDLKNYILKAYACRNIQFLVRPIIPFELCPSLVDRIISSPLFNMKLYVESPCNADYFYDMNFEYEIPLDDWKNAYEYYSQMRPTIVTDIMSDM